MIMEKLVAKVPSAAQSAIAVNVWTEPFWAAGSRHELVFPKCGACGNYRMPPTPFCPLCRSQAIAWIAYGGPAVLYSYTVVSRAIAPGIEASLPYVPAIVDFPDAGGVRLVSNVVDAAIDELWIGMALKPKWLDRADGSALPVFVPV